MTFGYILSKKDEEVTSFTSQFPAYSATVVAIPQKDKKDRW